MYLKRNRCEKWKWNKFCQRIKMLQQNMLS